MHQNYAKLKAHLSEIDHDRKSALVQLINQNIKPPNPLTEDEVHIRVMYIISDQVNSYGGKFPTEEMEKVALLLIDSPVLVGHRKDKLPVGRNFHSELVNEEGINWVKSYFYWMKSAEGSSDLKENIDGGIYKECSIGFIFDFPECSICGEDIRRCEHRPLKEYKKFTEKEICYFNYRRIEKVLETSLVYRGAVPNTSVGKKLITDHSHLFESAPELISSLDQFEDDRCLLVTAHYEGIDVIIEGDKQAVLRRVTGEKIPDRFANLLFKSSSNEFSGRIGRLVGLRGKERCPVDQLEKYLNHKSSRISRVMLYLYPEFDTNLSKIRSVDKNIKIIPYLFALSSRLDEAVLNLTTKEGVRIFDEESMAAGHSGYIYKRSTNLDEQQTDFFSLNYSTNESVEIMLRVKKKNERYNITGFAVDKFIKGGRFLADKLNLSELDNFSSKQSIKSNLESSELSAGGTILNLTGDLSGRLFIQQVVINNRQRYMIYLKETKGDGLSIRKTA